MPARTQAVLGALADSETALNRYASARTTLDERAAARDQRKTALELTQQRYRAGEDDLSSVLEAQSAFSNADEGRIAAAQDTLEDYAALIKALGGGWGGS